MLKVAETGEIKPKNKAKKMRNSFVKRFTADKTQLQRLCPEFHRRPRKQINKKTVSTQNKTHVIYTDFKYIHTNKKRNTRSGQMVGICKVGFLYLHPTLVAPWRLFCRQLTPRYAHTRVGRSKLYFYLFIEVIWINGVCRVWKWPDAMCTLKSF